MKRLKRDVMNTIANFEVDVSMTYKLKYNQALEKATYEKDLS